MRSIRESALLWRLRAVLTVAIGRGLAARTSLFAAAIAFHALLALAPIALIMLPLSRRLLGEEAARRSLAEAVVRFAGRGSDEVVTAMLGMVAPTDKLSTGTFLGVVLLLYFASSFLSQVQAALDAIWEVESKSLARALLDRVVAFGETLVALAAVLLVLAVGVLRSLVWPLLRQSGAVAETAWTVWTALGTLGMIFGVLAIGYRHFPSRRPRPSWRVALAGAVPATILLGLANELIRWLVAGSSLAALYGAAGSMIIFLLWVYYSAWVFLFGAEFSRAWSTGESSGGVEVPSRPTRT